METDFHFAGGRLWAAVGQTEGADMCRPTRVFSVGNPTTASRVVELGEWVARWAYGNVSGGVGALMG